VLHDYSYRFMLDDVAICGSCAPLLLWSFYYLESINVLKFIPPTPYQDLHYFTIPNPFLPWPWQNQLQASPLVHRQAAL
jgi:hypothetical protein